MYLSNVFQVDILNQKLDPRRENLQDGIGAELGRSLYHQSPPLFATWSNIAAFGGVPAQLEEFHEQTSEDELDHPEAGLY